MICVLWKFRSPGPVKSRGSSGFDMGDPALRVAVPLYSTLRDSLQALAASRGEGELRKQTRTERGYVTGSGINTSQPRATDWLRRSWAFLTPDVLGVRGPVLRNSPAFMGLRMSKSKDLGWAWKPDEQTIEASQSHRARKAIKRREKKNGRKLSKTERLCRAPGHIFYRSRKWRFLRWKVLAKYGRKCMDCDAVDVELHVDHIKPRSKFPQLSLKIENLQVLCRDCNMAKSNEHNTDYREESIGRDIDKEIAAEARRKM